jgi:phage terminase Nu1 subunit (DNA packaging protein)
MSVTPETIVSDVELAALLKVSTRRIRQLAEAGTIERVGVNQYELGPSFQAVLEEAAGSGSALVRERTRKVRADADAAEFALAVKRGEYARVELYKQIWAASYAVIRQNVFHNLPQRAWMRLQGEKDEAAWKAVLKDEIRSALQQSAEADISEFLQPEGDASNEQDD